MIIFPQCHREPGIVSQVISQVPTLDISLITAPRLLLPTFCLLCPPQLVSVRTSAFAKHVENNCHLKGGIIGAIQKHLTIGMSFCSVAFYFFLFQLQCHSVMNAAWARIRFKGVFSCCCSLHVGRTLNDLPRKYLL